MFIPLFPDLTIALDHHPSIKPLPNREDRLADSGLPVTYDFTVTGRVDPNAVL